MTESWSLRTRLMTSLVALAAMLFSISVVQNYLAYRDTSSRLFDDSLRESAGLLLQLAEHELGEHGQTLGIALLRAETRTGPHGFQFQIWTPEMQASSRAGRLSGIPLLEFSGEGFGWTMVQGHQWRSYSAWNSDRSLQIQIAQPQHQRNELDRQALLRLGIDVLILLGIAAMLIWWIVTASVRPLLQTAARVSQRSERDLGAVDARGAPREVQPLIDAINRLLRRMGHMLRMERNFTADAAHELRTPLAAIRANAQVLVAARDTAERESTARDLIASVDRSTRLVEQLLSLARADQSAGAGQLQRLDLAEITDEQCRAHRAMAARLGVQLTCHLQSADITGDQALLAVLIRNLIDNALRYTPAGGAVALTTSVAGDKVLLTVDDTGPGIAVAERERVFERFYRVAGPKASGSGLGLSIVQRIAELHAASISIGAGQTGTGTCVRVEFPAPAT